MHAPKRARVHDQLTYELVIDPTLADNSLYSDVSVSIQEPGDETSSGYKETARFNGHGVCLLSNSGYLHTKVRRLYTSNTITL